MEPAKLFVGFNICAWEGVYSSMTVGITGDGSGEAIIVGIFCVWGPSPNAQRLSPDGEPLWGEGGVQLFSGPQANFSLFQGPVVSDGSGGAIFVTETGKKETYLDRIYAQRIDSQGKLLWTDEGVQVWPALAGDASAESDIELAKEIAQVEVAENVGVYPEWEGAEATGGQPYCNLEGDVICYWFAVSKEGKTLGSVVVGSSLYEHAIFQVGSGSPPSIPTADEVSSSVEKCLGLEVTQKDIGEPLRLVYATYSFYFAIYDIEGQLIGIDLVRKEAVPASELRMMIASPEQYRQYKEERAKPLGEGKSLNLSVPTLDMANYTLGNLSNNNNCGPTSGSMIVVYHKEEHGYANFDDWTECHSGTDHTGLYYTMKCNQPWPGVFLHDAGLG